MSVAVGPQVGAGETAIDQAVALDAVVRKVAWRLIPVLFVAYVINFIDRVNISFAKLQMGQALGLDDVSFGIGAGMFFIGYFVFEVPSNMILERIGARRWMPIIMLAWGAATVAMAWVTTPFEFYALRFFIGFAEAGFFPGIVLFMTYWFPPSHRGRMMAVFMAALAISGVIGGPICGAIMQFFDGVSGMAGWQWLMIATGLPCVLVGVAIYLLVTDRPEQASWLTPAEHAVLHASLGNPQKPKASLREGFINFWSWNSAWIYFLLVCGGYGLSFWMPTLLHNAGVASNATVGLLIAIPNLVAAIVMILASRHSDRTQERRWHLVAGFVLGVLGYTVCAFQLDSVAGLLVGNREHQPAPEPVVVPPRPPLALPRHDQPGLLHQPQVPSLAPRPVHGVVPGLPRVPDPELPHRLLRHAHPG